MKTHHATYKNGKLIYQHEGKEYEFEDQEIIFILIQENHGVIGIFKEIIYSFTFNGEVEIWSALAGNDSMFVARLVPTQEQKPIFSSANNFVGTDWCDLCQKGLFMMDGSKFKKCSHCGNIVPVEYRALQSQTVTTSSSTSPQEEVKPVISFELFEKIFDEGMKFGSYSAGELPDDLTNQCFEDFNRKESKLRESEEVKQEGWISGYKETLKAAINHAIELQEQEQDEQRYQGEEFAFKYALEMLDKYIAFKSKQAKP